MNDEIERFLADLEKGELPAIVTLGGPERIFIDEALETIRRRALEGAIVEFNYDRVSAKQKSGDEIAALAKTLPSFAPRRLVEVHDAEALDEAGSPQLTRYLEDPPAETLLVLVFDNLDLRGKFPKKLKKLGALCRFDHPKERDLPRLVRIRAKRHKLTFTTEAEEALALTVGADVGLLERAFEKLALLEAEEAITLEQISEHVADTHLEDAFRLARAIANQNRVDALKSYAALERSRAVPLQLIGLIAWQLRQLIRARELLDEGATTDEIGRALNQYGARAKALVQAARKSDLARHRRRLSRVAVADQALKRSRAPQSLLMQRLILELCPAAVSKARGGVRSSN